MGDSSQASRRHLDSSTSNAYIKANPDAGYAAGVKETEAKYAKLVMAAIAHRHPAGHCPVPSLWPEDCSLDEALRQLEEKP